MMNIDRLTTAIFAGLVLLLVALFVLPPLSLSIYSIGAAAMPVDLDAQRSMAVAAWAMFGMALFQLVVAAIGIWFVRETLEETRRSIKASEISSQASQIAAEASVQGLKQSKELSDAELRPWLSISDLMVRSVDRYELHVGGFAYNLMFDCHIKNHGDTPATNVILNAEIFLRELVSSYDEAVASISEKFRSSGSNNFGEALFPSAQRPMLYSVQITEADIERAVSQDKFGLKNFSPILVVCLTYVSIRTSGVRLTREVFSLVSSSESGHPMVLTTMEKLAGLVNDYRTYAD